MSSMIPEKNYMNTTEGWVRVPTDADEQISQWREEAKQRNNVDGSRTYFHFNYPPLLMGGNRVKYEILFNRPYPGDERPRINYERISICNTLMWHDIRCGVQTPNIPGTCGQYEPGYSI